MAELNPKYQTYLNDNEVDVDISGEGFQGVYLNLAGEERKLFSKGKHQIGGGRTNKITTVFEVGIRPEREYYMTGDQGEVVEFKKGAKLLLAYGVVLSGGVEVKSSDLIFIGEVGGPSAKFQADPDAPQFKDS